MNKKTAIYMRVSTNQQSTRSQKPDLERWIVAQDPDKLGEVVWYSDTATGKNMDRPGWQKLQGAIDRGEVGCIVCWRLDRLGRTASGLCKLFEDFQARKVRLISLKDSIDLGTASGRLIAHVLASVAAYETELRGERVRAGQLAAKASGKTWGGSARGRRLKVTDEQVNCILTMHKEGNPVMAIARTTGLNRATIYRTLANVRTGHIAI